MPRWKAVEDTENIARLAKWELGDLIVGNPEMLRLAPETPRHRTVCAEQDTRTPLPGVPLANPTCVDASVRATARFG